MDIEINVIAREYDENGRLVREQEGHNTLTEGTVGVTEYNARVMILQRMTGDNNSGGITYNDSVFTQMELGTSALPTDEGLTSAYSPDTTEGFDTIVWDYTTSTSSIDVTFSTTWDSSYGALSGVQEAALQNFNNEALAVKIFAPALSKTTGGSLTLEWKITVA